MDKKITVLLVIKWFRYKFQYDENTLLKDILHEQSEIINGFGKGRFEINGQTFRDEEWEDKLQSTIGSIAEDYDKVWIVYRTSGCACCEQCGG